MTEDVRPKDGIDIVVLGTMIMVDIAIEVLCYGIYLLNYCVLRIHKK